MLFAGLVANFELDLKKVVAYSTLIRIYNKNIINWFYWINIFTFTYSCYI